MGFIKEFKTFIMRGNVLDMAVGVVMGGAFSAFVNSFVEDIITPVLGLLTGGIDFKQLGVTIGKNPAGEPLVINYGNLINNVIKFLIIALFIFLLIKSINHLHERVKRNKAEEPAEEAAPAPTELDILQDILAELKAQKSTATDEVNQ